STADVAKILTRGFVGKTTATRIALIMASTDHRSAGCSISKAQCPPDHPEDTYMYEHGVSVCRGGWRSWVGETALQAPAAATAKKYMRDRHGIGRPGYLSQLGPIKIGTVDWDQIEQKPFFCPDASKVPEMEEFMKAPNKERVSIGARITVVARGVPPGLGEPIFDRLDAEIAHALMSINAVKGVEIGEGFAVVEQRGSKHRDEITPEGFLSNHAGGILGGISSGQDIVANIALKPTSSLHIPGRSVDVYGNPVEVITKGRHDPCVGIRATPIAEAMLALVLMDHLLRHRGQNGAVQHNVPVI